MNEFRMGLGTKYLNMGLGILIVVGTFDIAILACILIFIYIFSFYYSLILSMSFMLCDQMTLAFILLVLSWILKSQVLVYNIC